MKASLGHYISLLGKIKKKKKDFKRIIIILQNNKYIVYEKISSIWCAPATICKMPIICPVPLKIILLECIS